MYSSRDVVTRPEQLKYVYSFRDMVPKLNSNTPYHSRRMGWYPGGRLGEEGSGKGDQNQMMEEESFAVQGTWLHGASDRRMFVNYYELGLFTFREFDMIVCILHSP